MLISSQWVRFTLWLSCPFNLVAAVLFGLPASAPARLVGMPAPVPAVYTSMTAFLIALFGFTYAWLASRPELARPLIGLLAIAKCGVFGIAVLLCLGGRLSFALLGLASLDGVLGALWLGWLMQQRD